MAKQVIKPVLYRWLSSWVECYYVQHTVLIYVRLFDRAGNPPVFNIYCGVPPIYMGFGRYYSLIKILSLRVGFWSGQMLLHLALRAYTREAV